MFIEQNNVKTLAQAPKKEQFTTFANLSHPLSAVFFFTGFFYWMLIELSSVQS